MGNCHLINRCRERRLDLDPVLIAEFISAAHFPHQHGAVTRKFPHGLIFSSRHLPFADDAGLSAAGQDKQHNSCSGYAEQARARGGNNSHHRRVITPCDWRVEPKRNLIFGSPSLPWGWHVRVEGCLPRRLVTLPSAPPGKSWRVNCWNCSFPGKKRNANPLSSRFMNASSMVDQRRKAVRIRDERASHDH